MDVRTGVAVGLLALVLVAAYLMMWRGWQRRAARHADWPSLPQALPAADTLLDDVAATYLGTTAAGDWLDRVVGHGLERRGTATVAVTGAGVVIVRAAEPPLAIPAQAVDAVRADRAAAGRAVRRPEYVIVTWQHGGQLLDTALRPHHRDDLGRLVDAVQALVEREVAS
jgi:hypothetical protein